MNAKDDIERELCKAIIADSASTDEINRKVTKLIEYRESIIAAALAEQEAEIARLREAICSGVESIHRNRIQAAYETLADALLPTDENPHPIGPEDFKAKYLCQFNAKGESKP